MARIRTIKPEFFTSEDICALDHATRLLYIALWCEADREGRIEWKPRTWKLRFFPGDSFDIDASARVLVASGLVVQYGEKWAYIPSFAKHQHINPRETASSLPDPADFTLEANASARVNDASLRVTDTQGGREGKGREGKEIDASATPPASSPAKRKKPATPMPENFSVSERVKDWATAKGFDRLPEHLEAFKGKATAKGYTYADWDAAFMEAIREDWAKLRGPNANQPRSGQQARMQDL